MWLLTPDGFYSAVAHVDDPDLLVVRSRVLKDSELLAEKVTGWRRKSKDRTPAGTATVPVEAYQHSDYPWRVIIARREWIRFLGEQADDITYTNFKNEVTKRQGQRRHDIYSRVWGVLLSLEKLPGAMKGHTERAVPHPKFGTRGWSWRDYEAAPSAEAQPTLLDLIGDDAPDKQIQGEGVHSDCTFHACVAPVRYPACQEKNVTV